MFLTFEWIDSIKDIKENVELKDLEATLYNVENLRLDKFMDNATRFFSKSTNKELYKYVNILEYHDGTYVLTNPISDTNIREMRNNMDASDIEEFDKFIEDNWGIKAKDNSSHEEEKVIVTKKRGRKPKDN